MTPEEIQRVKDLLPTTLGSEEIRGAIAANGGYCPCQGEKKPSTRCHCAAFRKSDIGEVCYCGIYVKQAKDAKKKGAK